MLAPQAVAQSLPGAAPPLALSLPGAAPDGQYDACLDLVARDPAAAEVMAERWLRAGGETPARHCQAMAIAATGAKGQAAARLVDLAARDRSLPDATRAEILVQAGEFHLADGDLAAGLVAADAALRLQAPGPAALTLRARLRVETGDVAGAIADLDTALGAAPPEPERLVLRAGAKRRLGDLIGAQSDALWALQLAPDFATAWLERGRVEAKLRRPDEARASWIAAIEHDRDGTIRPLAQLALQKLEAGIE